MCKIFGYCRVSTAQQKLQRQIENAKSFNNDIIIIKEKQSAKDIENRTEFKKLLSKVKSGDSVVFDEVSRMSRNAEEGYNLYMELYEKGIDLIFLKERHIDTEEFKRRTQRHIERITTQDNKIDNLINGILDLVEEFEKENLKDNIRIAFERAEQERLLMIQRIKNGKEVSDNTQGRPVGSKNKTTEKESKIKQTIKELSKDFQGTLTDEKIIKEYLKVARNTYYKYKKELKEEIEKEN